MLPFQKDLIWAILVENSRTVSRFAYICYLDNPLLPHLCPKDIFCLLNAYIFTSMQSYTFEQALWLEFFSTTICLSKNFNKNLQAVPYCSRPPLLLAWSAILWKANDDGFREIHFASIISTIDRHTEWPPRFPHLHYCPKIGQKYRSSRIFKRELVTWRPNIFSVERKFANWRGFYVVFKSILFFCGNFKHILWMNKLAFFFDKIGSTKLYKVKFLGRRS
ncbi:hypothetical protein EGR_05010 [Echinococcus granulosus]|uniref:Uncharacterized protein n=1 Tax=Echinococcus granulosus TaxID=6210 RepID=W6UPF4_ECHGR|nr:hypothetical protein EGR_05010 [Echinococcus granulosus]EUB60157.1 hypothetical protein EGR_05010 [Echinococcus granulosus]